MNIHTDSLETTLRRLEQMQQGQTKPVSSLATQQGFAAVFAEEIGSSSESDMISSVPVRSGMIDPALFVSTMDGSAETSFDPLADVTSQASGVLDSWDLYADTLSKGSPRAAWTALSGMDAQLQSLRGSLSGLAQPDLGLESVVNELEVLSATERFKFNRGDYM